MRVPTSLRRLTDPVLERVPVPIVAGTNRGRLWSLASAGSGYVDGRRARAQMRLLRALIKPAAVVWDVGAHHGYVTLLAAGQVGPTGHVHSFEPSARNLRILQRHLRWNRVRNVVVHRVALGSHVGEARFGGGYTSKMHALGRGEERVRVSTGNALVQAGEAVAPTFVKIDVEGAEAEVLAGMMGVLPPEACLLIALHSAAVDEECVRLLRTHGFEQIASTRLEEARRTSWSGDPDLFCMGPGHDERAEVRRLLDDHHF